MNQDKLPETATQIRQETAFDAIPNYSEQETYASE